MKNAKESWDILEARWKAPNECLIGVPEERIQRLVEKQYWRKKWLRIFQELKKSLITTKCVKTWGV